MSRVASDMEEQGTPLLDDLNHGETSSKPFLEVEEREIPATIDAGYETPTPPSRSQALPSKKTWLSGWSINPWSILPRYIQPGGRQKYKQRRSPTSYLDALRGYAAVLVYIYHCWDLPQISVFHWHFIRVPWVGGPGMVAIFFVISGYVLSYRLIKLIRMQESAKLLDSLASSIFRRYLRLYLSTAFATHVSAWCIYFGWSLGPFADRRLPTLTGQLWDWFRDAVATSNPFANIEGWIHDGVFFSHYLGQMWTIPVEYRGSIVIFLFCAAACKMTTRCRMLFSWVVVAFSYYWRVAYVVEFMFGVFLAELSLILHPERHGLPSPPNLDVTAAAANNEKHDLRSSRKSRVAQQVISYILLIVGLFLLGQPEPPALGSTGPWPWQYLQPLIPSWYGDAAYTFWLSIAACCVVSAVDLNPTLQRPFEWSFSQYIGDLSFGIYAMHVILLYSLYQPKMLPWQVRHLGDSTIAYLPGALVLTVLLIWVADYFSRVDKRIVRFGRWLQTKSFVKWE
ncbi:uncharacterized protein PV06_06944 [Exophiala oligosperma]|uniref:Acyltransferase 3 domain-containing protein n=2 Tax=Chaetothyriales TaxID=34395 RepID=A0A0D2BVA2_9EURO|nr:uncharacterized protein PV06_06944 [Exophiala oligosperma]KAJ9640829.1 hypothetical protein H2204_003118 [Knufia peltigerae]KIW41382.1 hypothetical protein PV06_06944 [Exophiala oligosperma]